MTRQSICTAFEIEDCTQRGGSSTCLLFFRPLSFALQLLLPERMTDGETQEEEEGGGGRGLELLECPPRRETVRDAHSENHTFPIGLPLE